MDIGNHKDLAKVPRDFWFTDFVSLDLKIHRLIWIFLWIFGCFESDPSMFCLKSLQILNLTNAVFL
jgi:hypothetical protein